MGTKMKYRTAGGDLLLTPEERALQIQGEAYALELRVKQVELLPEGDEGKAALETLRKDASGARYDARIAQIVYKIDQATVASRQLEVLEPTLVNAERVHARLAIAVDEADAALSLNGEGPKGKERSELQAHKNRMAQELAKLVPFVEHLQAEHVRLTRKRPVEKPAAPAKPKAKRRARA